MAVWRVQVLVCRLVPATAHHSPNAAIASMASGKNRQRSRKVSAAGTSSKNHNTASIGKYISVFNIQTGLT